MEEIRCKNNGSVIRCPSGSTLSEIYSLLSLNMPLPPVGAKVNNEVMGMGFRIFGNKQVEYIDVTSSLGHKIYVRSLVFVLAKAVHDLFPEGEVRVEFPVSNGYYCRLNKGDVKSKNDVFHASEEDVRAIQEQMKRIIAAALPIQRHTRPTEEVLKMFPLDRYQAKNLLIKSQGKLYTTFYSIGDFNDFFHEPLLTNTQQLNVFGLEPYCDGILLRTPMRKDPTKLGDYVRQDKMFDVFADYHKWQDTMGISTVGVLNAAIETGHTKDLITVFEALQEKKLSHIADEIAKRGGVKVVLIAGPSSSGKTTTCKRLSIQLLTNGIRPIGISLDDYFCDREKTPRDEKGDYDYESLYALNLPLFNQQLNALINGEEVELPRYNFITGMSEKSGKVLKMSDNEVLVIEGIHALNPELTSQIPQEQIFRIYASALTTITLDDHNYIPTTDNRLLRRMIRDYKYRGQSAQDTIKRWPSVRAGEDKWIFPFQENADMMFNTAMLFELAVIKTQAEPLLEQVPECCDEYAEAKRLLHLLEMIRPIPENQIPSTSLLREFLGGSMFDY